MKTFTCPVSYSSIPFISIMYPTYIQVNKETQDFEQLLRSLINSLLLQIPTIKPVKPMNSIQAFLKSIENHSNQYNKILKPGI